jgi:adenylate cyclase
VPEELTLAEVARHAGVSAQTLRRWADGGVIPGYDGAWTESMAAHARIVARLRERGHSLDEIREAGEAGRLAFAYTEELFPGDDTAVTLDEAAEEVGLEAALIERIYGAAGFPAGATEHLNEDDLQLLRYISAVLAAGFPLVAFLQLVRVYGQAMAQIADAEVRLFHLYVLEPLMRDGVPGL